MGIGGRLRTAYWKLRAMASSLFGGEDLRAYVKGRIVYPVAMEDFDVDELAYYERDFYKDQERRLLVLASGGDNALSALATGAFASVLAVDLNPAQIYLTELKAAAARALTRQETLRLINVPGALIEQWPLLAPLLSPDARDFWSGRLALGDPSLLRSDTCWQLRFLGALLRRCGTWPVEVCLLAASLLFDLFPRMTEFWGVPEQQYRLCPRDNLAAMRVVLRGVVERGARGHVLGAYVDAWYEWKDGDCPRWIGSDEAYARLRDRLEKGALECVVGDLVDVLAKTARAPTHVNVLDAMDWMSNSDIARLLLTFKGAAPSARLCWRSFGAPRRLLAAFEPVLDYDLAAWAGAFEESWPEKSQVSVVDRRGVVSRLPRDCVGTYASIHRARLREDAEDRWAVMEREAALPPPARRQRFSWPAAFRVLSALLSAPFRRRSASHAERLESFYAPQAADYDAYRASLLWGNEELLRRLPSAAGLRVYLPACGTARLLEALLERGGGPPARVLLRDLCPSLLAQAAERARRWNADVQCEDIEEEDTSLSEAFDLVLLTYALTMTRDPRKALASAWAAVAPGGLLAVADFTLSETQAPAARALWRRFFRCDGVLLDAEHPRLVVELPGSECLLDVRGRGTLPFAPPLLRCPFYGIIMKKAEDGQRLDR